MRSLRRHAGCISHATCVEARSETTSSAHSREFANIMSETFDIFVIGAGVAGMTAAEEAIRRGLRVCVAEELMFGGLVVNVNQLRPVPDGLPASGGDLAATMMTSLADLGCTILMVPVTSLERDSAGVVQITTTEGTHSARCVVLASGARLRKLGISGEERFEHRGVAHCADCDGPLYRGEVVVVVGGGDSALQGALSLAGYCSAVHLVHRGTAFAAWPEFVEVVRANPRITVHFQTVAESLEGTEAVEAVRVKNLQSGETRALACKGFFAYVGLEPNTAFLPPSIEMQSEGIRVNEQLETSMQDVFAIGAVRSGHAGRITDAMADARVAVAAACARLRSV
jgi:thioredoxin reductase (NADPH)